MGRRKAHPHLLRTDADADVFAGLVRAVENDAIRPHRVGWLDWRPGQSTETDKATEADKATVADDAVPEGLAAATAAGAHRAVRVGAEGSVAVSRRKGPAVLADVVRVHFPGCRLVLVRGAIDAPVIRPLGDGRYEIASGDGVRGDGVRGGGVRVLDAAQLAARLRRPRPFGPPAGG